MYFKDFPQFLYDFNYGSGVTKTSLVRDITRNIRFRRDILANITLFDEYDVIDGETPEIIAEKFYGTPEYHWVVMLANERFDNNSDFPLMEPELQRHISTVFNPDNHAKNWYFDEVAEEDTSKPDEQRLYFSPYDNDLPFDPQYLTSTVQATMSGSTDTMSFSYTFQWPDVRYGISHNGFDQLSQIFWQTLPYPVGNISYSNSSKLVTGVSTKFTDLFVGMDIYNYTTRQLIGRISEINSDSVITLVNNPSSSASHVNFYSRVTGNPIGELTVATVGREHNPVYFVNSDGNKINAGTPGAIPVSGDQYERMVNDGKRRIKIISPKLLATVLRNYKELL